MATTKTYTVTFSGVSDWLKGQDVTAKELEDRAHNVQRLLDLGAIAPAGSNEAKDAKASLSVDMGFVSESTEPPPPVQPSGQAMTTGQPTGSTGEPTDTLAEHQVDHQTGNA
jgi:hypothetical protein